MSRRTADLIYKTYFVWPPNSHALDKVHVWRVVVCERAHEWQPQLRVGTLFSFNNCTASINAGKTCFNNGQALLLTWAVCTFNPWFISPHSGAQGPCQTCTGLQRVAALGWQVLHKTPGSPESLDETGYDGVLSLRGARMICGWLVASFCHKLVECGTGEE